MNDTPLDRRFLLGGLAGAAGVSALAAMAKGGPLNPPAGSVASTAKALGEIEPRVAINATNTPSGGGGSLFRISQPGSYYLTGNVNLSTSQTGILVAASDVTIDLNGFSIVGVTGSSTGISVSPGNTNLTIRNGAVRNIGFNGIDASAITNVRIHDVAVVGCGAYGIITGDNAIIFDCICTANASGTVGGGGTASTTDGLAVGIGSIVRSCTVRGAGRYGINHAGYGLVIDCYVSDAVASTTSVGIFAQQRTIVRGCQVTACTTGIKANSVSRVESCHINNCTQFGIVSDNGGDTKIINNDVGTTGTAAGHAGIRVASGVTGCTIEGNRLESNYRHIQVEGAAHFIIRNSMAYTGAGGAMSIAGGNAFGPLVPVGGTGNIAGVALSDHPQANFSY